MIPLNLKLKIATSPVSGAVSRIRRLGKLYHYVRHPEIGLLNVETALMDNMLPRLVKRDAHCLDVGTHVGSVSYRLMELAPQGSVTMIEASPTKAEMLKQRFPDHELHSVAVSDESGEVSFFENIKQSGFSSLSNRESRGETNEIRVPCKRIDELFPDDRSFDFVKIDVEGHEYQALRGAESLLRRAKPSILFEAGGVRDEDVDEESNLKLFDWLTSDMDYEIFAVCDYFYNRPPIDRMTFVRYRTYPFTAFNYVAQPRTASQ